MGKPVCKFGVVLALLLLFPALAAGQGGTLSLTINGDDLGLMGHVRPGTWTPLLVTIDYQAPDSRPRQVLAQWVLQDVDGERVQAQRVVPLTPNQATRAWLYAVPPAGTRRDVQWRVNVLDYQDGEVGRLLAAAEIAPLYWVEPRTTVIATTSSRPLGLQYYEKHHTQHEEIVVLRGLDPTRLPDRWYGLSLLEALVWTPDGPGWAGGSGGDPGAPGISLRSHEALREWVRRGGHLLISLDPVAELWSASPLKDLLPPVAIQPMSAVSPTELRLGVPQTRGLSALPPVDVRTLLPLPGAGVGELPGVSVLRRTEQGQPVVVAHQVGLGRVTTFGFNLADLRLVRMEVPNSSSLWGDVFGWRSPAYTPTRIKEYLDSKDEKLHMADLDARALANLGQFVRGMIAMTGTYSGAMTAAVLLFCLYWVTAGPLAHAVLKQRGRLRYSWLVFAGSVLLFSAVAWGGALLLRPHDTMVEHFSKVTADAVTGEVHAHSWFSLFVPEHGEVEVTLDPDNREANVNTLAAPGLPGTALETVFHDTQTYAFDAGAPARLRLPFRSTAKQLELDYRGRLGDTADSLTGWWIFPQGAVRDVNGLPSGRLSHNLPGTLHEVLFIYCPGGGAEPVVTGRSAWEPGRDVVVLEPSSTLYRRLVQPPPRDNERWGGFLADRMHQNRQVLKTDMDVDDPQTAGRRMPRDAEIIIPAEFLSLYNTLPPPEWWKGDSAFGLDRPRHLVRPLGRELDLSRFLQLRCLVVLGFLKDSPLPAPLTVDGEKVSARGWTVVQWVLPVGGSSGE